MEDNSVVLEKKLQATQEMLDRATENSRILDNLVENWRRDQTGIEKVRDNIFSFWQARLASCQIDLAPLNHLNKTIDGCNRYLSGIAFHPNVLKAKQHILKLFLTAAIKQILIFCLWAIIVIVVVAIAGGLIFGIFVLFRFLWNVITPFINQAILWLSK
jgi:hypothetical protein